MCSRIRFHFRLRFQFGIYAAAATTTLVHRSCCCCCCWYFIISSFFFSHSLSSGITLTFITWQCVAIKSIDVQIPTYSQTYIWYKQQTAHKMRPIVTCLRTSTRASMRYETNMIWVKSEKVSFCVELSWVCAFPVVCILSGCRFSHLNIFFCVNLHNAVETHSMLRLEIYLIVEKPSRSHTYSHTWRTGFIRGIFSSDFIFHAKNIVVVQNNNKFIYFCFPFSIMIQWHSTGESDTTKINCDFEVITEQKYFEIRYW